MESLLMLHPLVVSEKAFTAIKRAVVPDIVVQGSGAVLPVI